MTWLALDSDRRTRLHARSDDHLTPVGLCGVALRRARALTDGETVATCRMCLRIAARTKRGAIDES